MSHVTRLLFSLVILLAAHQSSAVVVSVNASADMSGGLSYTTILLPIGTTVTADVQFSIGPGLQNNATLSNASGTFTWTDAALGEQIFTVDGVHRSSTHSAGWLLLDFTGEGSVINGVSAREFSLRFDVGTNPFTSTDQLSSLILGGDITGMRVGASRNGLTHFGDLNTNVEGSVSEVPLPAAGFLFITGLMGLAGFTRAKSNKA